MSVESEILRIQRNVANAYAKVAEKGGTVPTQPNSANLAAAVATIPEGSSVPDDMPVIPKTLAEYNVLSTEERQSETMFIVSRPTSAEEQEWWSPMMTSDNAPTPFIASSSESGAGHPFEAFDNSLGTYWMSSNTANPWISIFIGGGKTIAGLKMRPFNYNDNNRLAFPKVFTIDGSNDGIQWETVFSADGTEDYDPQLGEYRECLFSRSQQYSYYRISMAENYRPSESDHYCVISDIQLANGTAPFPTKIKYKDETLNAGGGTGLPSGGTTGQALVKASNADGDVVWGDVSGGGEVYSTEERVVGTWIDGRPVYQKTEIIETIADIGYGPVLKGVDFDFLLGVSGCAIVAANEELDTPAFSHPIGTYNDITENTEISHNYSLSEIIQSKLMIGEISKGYDVKYFATFKYTKTTDIPPT